MRVRAQEHQHKTDSTNNIVLYFKIDGAILDSTYMRNNESLKKLDELIKNELIIPNLDSITIVASSSPDGKEAYYLELSRKRAESVKEEKKEEPKKEEKIIPPQKSEPETPVIPLIISKPLFAMKTNLLYDVLSAVNLEIEIPIGKQWSVAAEGIFPWWKASRADWTMQLLSGHASVKYWLGDRDAKEVLTGWNIGLYGGVGKYDLQLFDKDGEQGDFFDAGLQAAYAHKIGKHFHMEYSLGVGYLQRDTKEYDKVNDTMYGDIKVFRFPWKVERKQWFGPTFAKVSLVWLLNKKTVKKEGGVK